MLDAARQFGFLRVTVESDGVATVELCRPDRGNAFEETLWKDFPTAIRELSARDDVKVVIIKAQGPHFCTGLDTSYLAKVYQTSRDVEERTRCPARARMWLAAGITDMQAAFNALEECPHPVIAAVQGACVGAGVDMVCACDLRYCSDNASFCVKEADLGITADLGTLQRLPRIVGQGLAADLALTARTLSAAEAERVGLVGRCCGSVQALATNVRQVAAALAAKSPLALRGTKKALLHARDNSIQSGLEHVAAWNAAVLLSADLVEVMRSKEERRAPVFSKL